MALPLQAGEVLFSGQRRNNHPALWFVLGLLAGIVLSVTFAGWLSLQP